MFPKSNYEKITDRTRSVRLILDSVEAQHLISRQESLSSRDRQEIDRYTQDVLRLAPECMHPGDTCPRLEELAEVRHDRGRTGVNSFKISSGSREVYTTFAIEFEPLGEAQIELLQK